MSPKRQQKIGTFDEGKKKKDGDEIPDSDLSQLGPEDDDVSMRDIQLATYSSYENHQLKKVGSFNKISQNQYDVNKSQTQQIEEEEIKGDSIRSSLVELKYEKWNNQYKIL